MLPRVKIQFENGLLGANSPMDDGVIGLIVSATAVEGSFELETPYLILSLKELMEKGVTEENNPRLYKAVKEFYDEAPVASALWVYGVDKYVSMKDMLDKTKYYAPSLLDAANGEIRLLVVAKEDEEGYEALVDSGLDSDVYNAILNGQVLAEEYAESKFAPFVVLVEGRHYSGVAADLADLTTGGDNRVAVFIGDTVSGSKGACVGLLAGHIASIPVQRSIARVKSGAIKATTLYLGEKSAENGQPSVINDKGFICPRTFVGKAGYYYSDDKLATEETDDYALLPRRRVIDKAYRIAYQTLVNELGDEIAITEEGKIPAAICKNLQTAVERAIENNMTAYGNLGNDQTNDADTGVSCYVDYNQNIVATSKLDVVIRVRPYGYAKYFDVKLGFQTTV
jgi:hypothetical protein